MSFIDRELISPFLLPPTGATTPNRVAGAGILRVISACQHLM